MAAEAGMTAGAADSAQFGLDARRLEPWLLFQFAVGVSFLMVKRKVSQSVRAIKPAAEEGASDAAARMERLMKIKKELSRKCFHVLGGTTIVFSYYYGMKWGLVDSGYVLAEGAHPVYNFTVAFAPFVVTTWLIDFIRQVAPGINSVFKRMFGGVLREKESKSASGMSYFLPGALAASYCYPPQIAMLGLMFLTLGDAAAGLGTAMGRIPILKTDRKLEGTLGCLVVCFTISMVLTTGMEFNTKLIFSAATALWAAWTELWAEVIHMDDNLFIPVVTGCGMKLILIALGNPIFDITMPV